LSNNATYEAREAASAVKGRRGGKRGEGSQHRLTFVGGQRIKDLRYLEAVADSFNSAEPRGVAHGYSEKLRHAAK
jgi:hypothetical protein